MTKRILITAFYLVLFTILWFGLTLPILTIRIGAELPIIGNLQIHQVTQSIWQSIKTLHENKNNLVAFLILLFSIIIPVLKALGMLIGIWTQSKALKLKLSNIINIIGKWSMADVFVVSIFIAFLATNSNDAIHAIIEVGFYWFLGYCLLSIALSQSTYSYLKTIS